MVQSTYFIAIIKAHNITKKLNFMSKDFLSSLISYVGNCIAEDDVTQSCVQNF